MFKNEHMTTLFNQFEISTFIHIYIYTLENLTYVWVISLYSTQMHTSTKQQNKGLKEKTKVKQRNEKKTTTVE